MSTTDNEVRTRLTIAAEQAIAPLKAARTAASGLLDQLDRITHVAMGAAGLGGMFEFGQGIRDADRLYSSIAKLQAVTGSSVESLDAMVDVLEKGGVEGEHAEQVILRITKGLQSAEGAASLFGEQSEELRKKFTAMGIDIKKGPQDMLVQMATQVQRGRMQAVDLMRMFRMGPEQAAQMMYFLRQGPAEIARTMEAQKTDSSRITSESMRQYQTMLKAKRLAKDAIGDTFSIVYRTFLPSLTKVFQAISGYLEKWGPQIQRSMDYLTSHMGQVLKMAERIAVLSAANRGLQMVGAGGIVGAGKSVGSYIGKTFAAGAAAAPAVFGGGRIMTFLSGLLKLISGAKELAIAGAIIGGVVATIVSTIKLLWADWNGIRTSIMTSLQSIFGRLMRIAEAIWKPFAKLGDLLGKTLLVALDKFAWVLDKILWVAEKISWLVDKMGSAIGGIVDGLESGASWVSRKLGLSEENNPIGQGIYKDAAGLRQAIRYGANADDYITALTQHAMEMATGGATNAAAMVSKTGIVQDFRGSKFEVKQEFAEGFDAGKVVVAMADRLASLGERKLQSGFAPLYGVRG